MAALRVLLVALGSCLLLYTSVVAYNHGFGLLEVFFNDIRAMRWPGQFNLDFSSYLILSALWVSWRHHFSAPGLLLGVVALFCGGIFFTAYLLIASLSAKGDVRELLMGKARARS